MKYVELNRSDYNLAELPKTTASYTPPDRLKPLWEQFEPKMSKHLIRSAHYIPHYDIIMDKGPHSLRLSDFGNLSMNWYNGILTSKIGPDVNNDLKIRIYDTNPLSLTYSVIRTDTTAGYWKWRQLKLSTSIRKGTDRVIGKLFFYRPQWLNRIINKRKKQYPSGGYEGEHYYEPVKDCWVETV